MFILSTICMVAAFTFPVKTGVDQTMFGFSAGFFFVLGLAGVYR
jgi:hypothetical protein